MKPLISFTFFIALMTVSQAQLQTANWYFSDHLGLSFVSGSPLPLTDGQIANEEGAATISDEAGQLLFYTDGVTVWDRNHQVMPNGTGLMGDLSTTQPAIIIPLPGTQKYYIFTVDDGFLNPSDDGINYSVVDMGLNGGLGDIVSGKKNLVLVTHASEKITAVANAAGDGYWVVVFAPSTNSQTIPYDTTGSSMNTFYAFEVKAAGIVSSVVSPINITVSGGSGNMKFSPDGAKLAIANLPDNSAYVFNFDNSTGMVSNPVQLTLVAQYNVPYGLEFSPDGTKLYLNNRGDNATNSALMQYDLANANTMSMISNEQNYRAGLQLALDGKIYQTHTLDYGNGTRYLHVINHPNAPASQVDFQYNAVDLGYGKECHQGLPNFITSYFDCQSGAEIISTGNDTYEITTNEPFVSVTWDFGDGSQPVSTYPDNPPDNNHTQITHAYPANLAFTMMATIDFENDCIFEAVSEIFINGMEEAKQNNIKIFPNPAQDIVHVYIPDIKNPSISVFDVSGNYIYQNIPVNTESETFRLNFKGKKGLYFIKISGDKTSVVKKLWIQ